MDAEFTFPRSFELLGQSNTWLFFDRIEVLSFGIGM